MATADKPKTRRSRSALIEAGPDLVRCPFTVLIDKAEKAPFSFCGLRARSFIDPSMRRYVVHTERRYLGIGMGDYSLDGFQGRVAIERKSLEDFQGTLLGWPQDASDPAVTADWDSRRQVHRRARFKSELRKLQAMECKAVVVEATLGQCLDLAPCWGVRSSSENRKYLFSTYMAWQQEFRVPWIFCDEREMAAVMCFRILEKFWHRHRKEAVATATAREVTK
jgi:hypothetical protein